MKLSIGKFDISMGFAPGQAIATKELGKVPYGQVAGNAEQPVQPQSANPWPFLPSNPLPPMSPATEPQAWEVNIGYNLDYSPDKRPGARHDQLRSLSDSCPSMRLVIEALKKEIFGIEGDFVPTDRNEGEGPDDWASRADIVACKELFAKPDGVNYFSDWINAILEDAIVIGATALGKLRTVGGDHAGLRIIDSAKVVPIVTAAGVPPLPPAAAYYWYAYGVPYKEYTLDEVIYRPWNRRSWTPYGFGPVEQTLLLMTLAVNSLLYRNKAFTEGNLPPYLLNMPKEWSEATIREFGKYLDKRMGGNLDARSRALPVPHDTTATKLDMPYEGFQYEFEEFILRCFSWVMGVNPQPILKQMGMGGSHGGFQSNATNTGVKPFCLFIEELLNNYIRYDLGYDKVRFTWVLDEEQNPQLELQKHEALLKMGAESINEVRTFYNLPTDPSDDADKLMVLTATGYVPVEGSSEPKEPPPALAPFAGGQPPQDGQPGEQKPGQEPPEPPAKGKTQASELKAWNRKARGDIRKGRTPRPFYRT